jgi:hypothetical protein
MFIYIYLYLYIYIYVMYIYQYIDIMYIYNYIYIYEDETIRQCIHIYVSIELAVSKGDSFVFIHTHRRKNA